MTLRVSAPVSARERARSIVRVLVTSLALVGPVGCAARHVSPASGDRDLLVRAETLARHGCYRCLEEALEAYETLFTGPHALPARTGALRTTLLLALRAKELGLIGTDWIDRAREHIAAVPALAVYARYLEIVDAVPSNPAGATRAFLTTEAKRRGPMTRERIALWRAALDRDADADPFEEYFSLALTCSYGWLNDHEVDPLKSIERFPASLLIAYRAATCGVPRQNLLEEVVRREPRFAEAAYFLAAHAVVGGRLIEAERHLLEVFAALPEFAASALLLGDVYLAQEDMVRALDFYEKTLAVVPGHESAQLGRIQSLSRQGRHAEAIEAIDTLLAAETRFLSDCRYWRAWNWTELNELDKARSDIETAKRLYPTGVEIFKLSGAIALRQGHAEQARADLTFAIDRSPSDCEAVFLLGTAHAALRDWGAAAETYARAAPCYEGTALALDAKALEAEASALGEDRKAEVVARHRRQQAAASRLAANAAYNAAVGYANAGHHAQARRFAEQARVHVEFSELAVRLLARLPQ